MGFLLFSIHMKNYVLWPVYITNS